jgi:hypothetical protein
MNRGYVRLWRKSLDAGWIRSHKLWAFWTYCLLKASHKEFDAIVGLQVVHLMPGQFVFGLRVASKETGLSVREIRTILDFLRKAENLTIKTTNKFSIITIINWPTYQSTESENDTLNDKPLANKWQHTRTEEHKKKTFLSDSTEIRLSELLLKKILLRNPNHKKPNLQIWAKDIDRMIRIDHRIPEDIRAVVEWCQADPFWQNNILSPAKLRSQFDQLQLKRGTAGKKAAPALSSPSPLICPRCGRELVVKNDLYGDGCIHCQREMEART